MEVGVKNNMEGWWFPKVNMERKSRIKAEEDEGTRDGSEGKKWFWVERSSDVTNLGFNVQKIEGRTGYWRMSSVNYGWPSSWKRRMEELFLDASFTFLWKQEKENENRTWSQFEEKLISDRAVAISLHLWLESYVKKSEKLAKQLNLTRIDLSLIFLLSITFSSQSWLLLFSFGKRGFHIAAGK